MWAIQRLPIAKSAASDRCKAVLAAWMARGHSEAEIRRLVKLDEVPLEPLPELVAAPPPKRRK